MGQSQPILRLFSSFSHYNNIDSSYFNNAIQNSMDGVLGIRTRRALQDCKHRRNHGAMAYLPRCLLHMADDIFCALSNLGKSFRRRKVVIRKIIILLKMGQSRPLFVYFRSFHIPIQITYI